MSIQISKWSLLGPSLVIVAMALGLLTKYGVEDIYTHTLHIAQFILIIFTLMVMNHTYIKLYKLFDKKQKDTADAS